MGRVRNRCFPRPGADRLPTPVIIAVLPAMALPGIIEVPALSRRDASSGRNGAIAARNPVWANAPFIAPNTATRRQSATSLIDTPGLSPAAAQPKRT
jgi:hypothetical protein